MKKYNTGDSICFKNVDGAREYGTVQFQLSRPPGGLYGYEIETENGYTVVVHLDKIVDLEEVGRQAGEALDRWRAEDRRKADLLSELLGVLSFYAQRDGKIRYYGSDDKSDPRQVKSVQEILDEYRAKADPTPPSCRYGYPNCQEPHED